jgi:hypothetical protein
MSAGRPTLTRARVNQLAGEIGQAARAARKIDPETKGQVSYPGMCGGLEAILVGLVHDLAGPDAARKINQVLNDACSTEVPA